MFELLTMAVIATLIGLACLMLFWGIYYLTKNPAVADLGWALGMASASTYYYYATSLASPVADFMLTLILIWAARLFLLICYRLIRDKTDGRYEAMTANWESDQEKQYLKFFLAQGAAVGVLTLPVLFAVCNRVGVWLPLDWFAAIIALVGLVGEGVSDFQLQSFVRQKENKGKVCDVGLWRFSRHPNYFFEWVFWVGLFLFALSAPMGIISIASPIGLLVTLLFITGIPPAEEQALRSRGDAYTEYQKTTSRFIPWPPKDHI